MGVVRSLFEVIFDQRPEKQPGMGISGVKSECSVPERHKHGMSEGRRLKASSWNVMSNSKNVALSGWRGDNNTGPCEPW